MDIRKKYTKQNIIDLIIFSIFITIGGKCLEISTFIPNNIVGVIITAVSYISFLIALIFAVHYIWSRKKQSKIY